jgi:caffeoyl-CoA O-methyltransferase
MNLINPIAEEYVYQNCSPLDEVLVELEASTIANHPHAHMLSGKVQGKLLEMLSTMIGPARILEIGTFTGFSALCLAKGLRPGGLLHTIELRKEDAATAQHYFLKAGAGNRIRLHQGDAMEIIPRLNEKWDLVFLDADKLNYINYYERVLPFVSKGGWILADNVLFHGEIFGTPVNGKNAKAILAFNEHVAADKRVERVILTVRDGLAIIRKT